MNDDIFSRFELHLTKKYGQNFLTDQAVLEKIAQDADIADGTVVEIGAGAGTLTRVLGKYAKKVVAFEIDNNLQPVLKEMLHGYDNVQLVMGDIMRYDTAQVEALCGGSYSVVANIPYYITTPIVMKFVEEGKNLVSLTLTIQKEVAERLAAHCGTKQYGAITVAVNAVADVEITQILPRTLFRPQPNVDSAVVKITMRRNKFDIDDRAMFRKTVKTAFSMRRKTLVNNLCNGFALTKEKAAEILQTCNLPINCRGEQLSPQQFVLLANCLNRQQG